MRRLLIIFVCLVTLICCIESICMASSDIAVEVDNNKVNFDQQPVIDNGRTLIPLRGVFERLNCYVEWDNINKNVLIKKNNDTVSIKIGENRVYKNGVLSAEIDVPAKIINGRTMIPVRGVFELFDNYVSWNENTRTVEMYSSNGDSCFVDLKKVEEANKALSLLENCSNVKKTDIYKGNRSETIYSKGNDGKLNVHVINNSFEGYSDGEKYYEKTINGNIYEILYSSCIAAEPVQRYLPLNPDVSWSYNENEKIIFSVEKGDKYYVKTEISDISEINGLAESIGIENRGKYICRLILNADTFEVLSSESYQVIDGIEKNIASLKIEKNVGYNDEFIQSIKNGEKCNVNINLKIIDDNKEEKMKDIINKGYCFNLFGMENYNVYEDETCTKIYDFNKEITEDSNINLYMVRQ